MKWWVFTCRACRNEWELSGPEVVKCDACGSEDVDIRADRPTLRGRRLGG